MLEVFPLIFVAGAKVIFRYDSVSPLIPEKNGFYIEKITISYIELPLRISFLFLVNCIYLLVCIDLYFCI